MRFTKMHGTGNDFIILDNRDGSLPAESFPGLAASLCRRRFSVGADGLMIIGDPQQGGDLSMRFFNSDGSEGEMCGNGARCLCRYACENGLCGKAGTPGSRKTVRAETKAGPVTGWHEHDNIYTVILNDPTVLRLNMPLLLSEMPVLSADMPAPFTDISFPTGEPVRTCSYLELGSPGIPHAIVPVSNLPLQKTDVLRELGRSIRSYRGFPKGANVTFYEILPDGSVSELTYERGIEDFTLSCGTGTACTAAALALQRLVPCENIVFHTPGGTLSVSLTADPAQAASAKADLASAVKNIRLTGPAVLAASGEIHEWMQVQP